VIELTLLLAVVLGILGAGVAFCLRYLRTRSGDGSMGL